MSKEKQVFICTAKRKEIEETSTEGAQYLFKVIRFVHFFGLRLSERFCSSWPKFIAFWLMFYHF